MLDSNHALANYRIQENSSKVVELATEEKQKKSLSQRLYPFINLLFANELYAHLEQPDSSGCINIKSGSYQEFHSSYQVLSSISILGDRFSEAINDFNLTLIDPDLDAANYATLLGFTAGLLMEGNSVRKQAITFKETAAMYFFKVSAGHYKRYITGSIGTQVYGSFGEGPFTVVLVQLTAAGVMASGFVIKSIYYIAADVMPTSNMFRDMLFEQGQATSIGMIRNIWAPSVGSDATVQQLLLAAAQEALVGSMFIATAFFTKKLMDSGRIVSPASPGGRVMITTYTRIGKCAGYSINQSINYLLQAMGLNRMSRAGIMTTVLLAAGTLLHHHANYGIGTGLRNGFTYKSAEAMVIIIGLIADSQSEEDTITPVIENTLENLTELLVDLPIATFTFSYRALMALPDFLTALTTESESQHPKQEAYGCILLPASGTRYEEHLTSCTELKELQWPSTATE